MAYENWIVELALTTQPDDPFPAWMDITPWVETIEDGAGPWVAQTGRPTEFDTSQPGSKSLTLNNSDHRFTPGNPSSPLYPNFKQARRIRIRETIGYRTFPVFDGFIELPDIEDWAEQGVDQFITVTAVDRLTRMDRSRKFVSTLAEWILYNGGPGLQAYYPMLESSGVVAYDKSAYAREPMGLYYNRDATVTPTRGGPPWTAGNGTVLPGDDLAAPTWSPRLGANGLYAESARPSVVWANGINQTGADTITVAAWVNSSAAPGPSGSTTPVFVTPANGVLDFGWDPTNGWTANGRVNSASAMMPFAGLPVSMPMLVAVRLNLATATFEMWRHTDSALTAPLTGGTVPTSVAWNQAWIGYGTFTGSLSHVQVYLGNSTVYTRAYHLAQIQAGMTGLAGQTTGQRIRTLAAYAGIPAGQLLVDDGSVRMQNASLAGKSPLDPMREAEMTEQGLLIADRSGRLVFHDRLSRYNI